MNLIPYPLDIYYRAAQYWKTLQFGTLFLSIVITIGFSCVIITSIALCDPQHWSNYCSKAPIKSINARKYVIS